jgi:hypothetical protein
MSEEQTTEQAKEQAGQEDLKVLTEGQEPDAELACTCVTAIIKIK